MTTTVALTGASVLTCDRDGTVLADHTVLVGEDGSIEAVGPAQQLADRARTAQRYRLRGQMGHTGAHQCPCSPHG